jgi:ribosome recycling factor
VEALRDADMDLNPQTDGDNIIVRLPKCVPHTHETLTSVTRAHVSSRIQLRVVRVCDRRATDEYRQSLLKQATKMNEEVKNSIRRARQGALTDLKKHKDAISKDDMKKLENEVQKITDEYNKKAEQLHKAKEQAISGGGN